MTDRKGLHHRALNNWLEVNRPDVLASLVGREMPACRLILNEATGLQIKASDDVEDSCRQYLEAFKAQQVGVTESLSSYPICGTCGRHYQACAGQRLPCTGFLIFDPAENRDVWDCDACDRADCPGYATQAAT